jgi:hypothetical protein
VLRIQGAQIEEATESEVDPDERELVAQEMGQQATVTGWAAVARS